MRRALLVLALGLLAASPVGAQLTLSVGGGITSPLGDFADVAANGYHARAGVEAGIPSIPVSVRLDGDYHRLGEASASFESSSVLGGGVSVVFTLPGVGLVPYLLGGVGKYRLEAGPVGMSRSETNNGFQAGFGLELGAIGFGGFVEIRYVQVKGSGGDMKYIPLTVGLRL